MSCAEDPYVLGFVLEGGKVGGKRAVAKVVKAGKGRPGAQRIAVTNAGTIPDRGLFGVFLPDGSRVGELDEEMVYESRPGETFLLGASTWRIEEITHDRVIVTPAPGLPAKLPFWHGDGPGRPIELGTAMIRRQQQEACPTIGPSLSSGFAMRLATGEFVSSRRLEREFTHPGRWRCVVGLRRTAPTTSRSSGPTMASFSDSPMAWSPSMSTIC